MNSRHFVLAAGGTGGHMVPAAALAAELTRRGHRVALVSDARGVRFPGLFEGTQTHVLPAGRFQVGRPLGWAGAVREMWRGRAMARELYRTFKPAAVIGFGGYPAFPALLAAFADGIPTAIHEQNAVLGRVNRLVARKVAAIATSYDTTQRLAPGLAAKVRLVGNPVRAAVLALRERPLSAAGGGRDLPCPRHRRVARRERAVQGGARRARHAAGDAAPPVAGDPPGSDRGHRCRARQICRASDPGDLRDLHRRHAGRTGLGAPGDRARRRLHHRRADRRRPARHPGAAARRDRRPSDGERPRDDRGGRRADHRTGPVHAGRACQADAASGPGPRRAGKRGRARARSVGHPRAVELLADLVEGLGAPPAKLPVAVSQPAKVAYA